MQGSRFILLSCQGTVLGSEYSSWKPYSSLPDASPLPGSSLLFSFRSPQDSYARYLKSPIYKEMLAKAIEPQETTKRRQVEYL